jgi:hypothetical protein
MPEFDVASKNQSWQTIMVVSSIQRSIISTVSIAETRDASRPPRASRRMRSDNASAQPASCSAALAGRAALSVQQRASAAAVVRSSSRAARPSLARIKTAFGAPLLDAGRGGRRVCVTSGVLMM